MKKFNEVNFNQILSRPFESLTEEDKMLLALKGAIEKVKINPEDTYSAALMVATYQKLQNLGWSW